ncbi:MAG: hypothetical protein IPN18_13440 [Ignavibacteriales bacterium]|nr:hypothetical protein [Ignavibacteriales bacterium]
MEFVRENYHYFRAFEAGKLTTEEFIPMLMKAGEVEDLLSIDEFCFIYSEIFSINYDVAELLSRLKQNYRLFLLSNTQTPSTENTDMRTLSSFATSKSCSIRMKWAM